MPAGTIILHNKCTKNHDHILYCSWDMACDRNNCYFSFGAIFCFYSLIAQKNENFKNKKKPLEISSFCKCVPKIMIIRYTVPEIVQLTDVLFIFHFELFLPFYQKMRNSEKWKQCLEILFYTSVTKIMIIHYTVPEIWHLTDVTVIFHFGLFFPFYHPNSLKNENLKKKEKTPWDIIILHKCTKNHDHRLYYSWDMKPDGCNCYFSFWVIFHPKTP